MPNLRDKVRYTASRYPRAVKYLAIATAVFFIVFCTLTSYYFVLFSRLIDARLHGERDRVVPRVFARPLELLRGEGLSQKELLDRLNDLGYTERTLAENPGEFGVDGALVTVMP